MIDLIQVRYIIKRMPSGEADKKKGIYWNDMQGWTEYGFASKLASQEAFRAVRLLSRRGFDVQWELTYG